MFIIIITKIILFIDGYEFIESVKKIDIIYIRTDMDDAGRMVIMII